ncbi:MAG: hypothetical protein ACR2KP_17110 [Egibacteraceae bacterium]
MLWLLLLPFALVNLSGWMRRPSPSQPEGKEPISFRVLVRLLALTTTLAFIAWPVQLAMDVMAYQCGGQAVCVATRRVMAPFGASWLADYPGRRIAAAALVPLVVIILLGVLARRSRRRYEEAESLARSGNAVPTQNLEASRQAGLTHPDFWQGDRLAQRLGRLHLAAAIAFVAVVLARATDSLGDTSVFSVAVLVLAVGVLAMAAVGVCIPSRLSETHSGGVLWSAVLTLVLATIAAVAAPAGVSPPGAMLPGFSSVLAVVFGALLLELLGLVAWIGLGARRRRAAIAAGTNEGEKWARITDDDTFKSAGPVVAATLGVVLLLASTAAISIRVMDLLGQPTAQGSTLYTETVQIVEDLDDAGVEPGDVTTLDPTAAAGVEAARDVGGEPLAAAVDQALAVTAPAAEQTAAGAVAWLVYPPSFDLFAIVFTVGMAVLAIAMIGHFVLIHHRRAAAIESEAEASYADEVDSMDDGGPPLDADTERVGLLGHPRWRAAFLQPIVRWRLLAETLNRMDAALSATVAVVLGLSTVYVAWRWIQSVNGESAIFVLPDSLQWLASLSSWVMASLPIVALLLLRAAYRDPLMRRRVASIFDVVTFWPRAWHPLAPPAYSERAVPELARRIVRIGRADGRTLLSAHSQGTVLAAAAVAQLPQSVRSTVAVATHGSPLGRLYRRFFPAYFGGGTQRELRATLAGIGGEARWRNFYRPTDVIGGPVFDGPDADADPGAVADAHAGPAAPDVLLRDPATQLLLLGNTPPRVLGHVSYNQDPAFVRHLDELCDALRADLAAQTDSIRVERHDRVPVDHHDTQTT